MWICEIDPGSTGFLHHGQRDTGVPRCTLKSSYFYVHSPEKEIQDIPEVSDLETLLSFVPSGKKTFSAHKSTCEQQLLLHSLLVTRNKLIYGHGIDSRLQHRTKSQKQRSKLHFHKHLDWFYGDCLPFMWIPDAANGLTFSTCVLEGGCTLGKLLKMEILLACAQAPTQFALVNNCCEPYHMFFMLLCDRGGRSSSDMQHKKRWQISLSDYILIFSSWNIQLRDSVSSNCWKNST